MEEGLIIFTSPQNSESSTEYGVPLTSNSSDYSNYGLGLVY